MIDLRGREQMSADFWPAGAAYERTFFEPLLDEGVRPFVANVDTTLLMLKAGPHVFPVTVNDREYDNSYVCSPYSGTVGYPLEELSKIPNRAARWLLAALIHTVGPLLRAAGINRVVCANNWLFSTNLYPDWHGDELDDITTKLRDHSPGRAILFRSLNEATNERLCRAFTAAGYLLAPSRMVYCYDGARPDYLRRPNTRWDLRLLQRTAVVPHDELTDADDDDIVRLYELLYLKKYSYYNPQFTAKMVRHWRRQGLLQMFGVRGDGGRLDAIVGLFCKSGVMTAPLVGYDTAQPKSRGLYRLLMAVVLREAAAEKMFLNLSSGTAHFKRLRGGVPRVEYSAVFCDHLPLACRAAWRSLAFLLSQLGVRVLKRYEL